MGWVGGRFSRTPHWAWSRVGDGVCGRTGEDIEVAGADVGRWSSRRKMEAVLRVLKGEALEPDDRDERIKELQTNLEARGLGDVGEAVMRQEQGTEERQGETGPSRCDPRSRTMRAESAACRALCSERQRRIRPGDGGRVHSSTLDDGEGVTIEERVAHLERTWKGARRVTATFAYRAGLPRATGSPPTRSW